MKKNTPPQKKTRGRISFRSTISGGRIGVSAAGSQSKSSRRRRVAFADTGMYVDVGMHRNSRVDLARAYTHAPNTEALMAYSVAHVSARSKYSYEEFTRLAETRLAQNNSN